MKTEELSEMAHGIAGLLEKDVSAVYKEIDNIVSTTLCAAIKYKNLSIPTAVMGIMAAVKTPLEAILYSKGAEVILGISAIRHKFVEHVDVYESYIANYHDFEDEQFIGEYIDDMVMRNKDTLREFIEEHIKPWQESNDIKAEVKQLAAELRKLNREQLYSLAVYCAA